MSSDGKAFLNGGEGGSLQGFGGFGGGGAASSQNNRRGGGGGGYSGGGGAGSSTSGIQAGGGGGSYNSGLAQHNTAALGTGDGKVVITFIPSNTNNDAAASAIPDLEMTPCAPATQTIKAEITNFGKNDLDSVRVFWAVDGILQGNSWHTVKLAQYKSTIVTLGTYNFSQTARTYDLKVYTSVPNNKPDDYNANDTVSATIGTRLGGTFTINSANPTSGSNFKSFTDLANALNSFGVCAPVIVNVASGSGPYNEQITLNEIDGASATNTITINGNGTTLSHQATSSASPHTLLLDGTDHVTINNMTIESAGTTYGMAIVLTNTADSNNFNNLHIKAPITATNSVVVPFSISGSANSPTTYGSSGNFNTVSHCLISGGYNGICIYGPSGSGDMQVGNKVIDTKIEDFYYYGLRAYYQEDMVIERDTIERPSRTSVSTAYPLYLYYPRGINVEGNVIRNLFGGSPTSTSTIYALRSYGSYGTSSQINRYYNNLIYDLKGNASTLYGTYFYNPTYSHIYHNSIILNNTSATQSSGTVYGFYTQSGNETSEIKNNLIYITRGGTNTKYGLYFSDANPRVSDYNNVYIGSPGTNNNFGYNGAAAMPDLSSWQSTGWGAHSTEMNPHLIDAAQADFRVQNPLVVGSGENLTAEVPDDLAGVQRPVPPTPGAYEAGSPAAPHNNDAASITFEGLDGTHCAGTKLPVKVIIYNAGTNNISSLDLGWSIDGVAQTPVSYSKTLVAYTASTGRNIDTIALGTVTVPASGSVKVKAWTSKPNNGTDFYVHNDTATSGLIRPAMNGAFTLDDGQITGGANYNSLSDFADDLRAQGICGPVVLNVAPGSGPYNEQVAFPPVLGSSATNTITINGNGATVSNSSSSSTTPYTILLNGTDYMTIRDLNVEANGASYAQAIHLTGNADHNSFIGCNLSVSITTTNTYAAPFSISGTINTTTGTGNGGSFNTIDSCVLTGGYYGATFYQNTSAPYAQGNKILNSRIEDFYSSGIRSYYQDDFVAKNDTIQRPNRTSSTTLYLAYIYSAKNSTFESNVIRNPFGGNPTATSTCYGLYQYQSRNVSGDTNRIYNNAIYDINGNSSTLYAMYLMYPYYTGVYYNTINLDNASATASGSLRGIYAANGNSTADIRNNIISITRGGTAATYGLYYTSNSYQSDYNDVYVKASGSFGYYSGARSSLANWRSINSNWGIHSLEEDPQFANPAADDLAPQNSALTDAGLNMSPIITKDILGVTRQSAPTPGAVEVFSPVIDIVGMLPSGPGYCPGDQIKVQYKASHISSFNSGNIFTVQLSDQNGSFANPTNIGSLTSTATSGSITVTIPPATAAGNGYTTRVVSSNPAITGNDAGTNLTINPAPRLNVEAEPASSICVGDSVALFGGHNIIGGPSTTYQWDKGVVDGTTFLPPSGATTYTVVATAGSCTDTGEITVTVNDLPPLVTAKSTPSPAEICSGEEVTLDYTVTGASQHATSYNWDKGVTNNAPFKPTQTETYTITAKDQVTGCERSDTITVRVSPAPVITVSATPGQVCQGEQTTLSANGASSYTWNKPVTPGVPFTPTSTETYTATGMGPNGCEGRDSVTVTVYPTPTVTANASPSTDICEGNEVTLTGGGANNYDWDHSVTDGVAFVPTHTETYKVIGRDIHSCIDSAEVTVTVKDTSIISIIDTICRGEVYTLGSQTLDKTGTYKEVLVASNGCDSIVHLDLTVNSLDVSVGQVGNELRAAAGADSYQWLDCNNNYQPIPGATQQNYTSHVTGDFSVLVTKGICSDTSVCFHIIGDRDGIQGASFSSQITLYPNPNSGQMTVQSDYEFHNATVSVINVIGQTVKQINHVSGNSFKLDIRRYAAGVYYVEIREGAQIARIKFTKE